MIEFHFFYKLIVALGIGFIIGMQREHSYFDASDRHPAGVRTFSMVGLCGAIAGLLSVLMNSSVPFAIGFIVIGLLLTASHLAFGFSHKEETAGITTSIALVLVYLLGCMCWYNCLLEACVGMVILLLLLNSKKQLHEFANKISTEDIIATVKFAVIILMIFPFLPNKSFGPSGLEVLNPHTIWLFVVFISAIGFVSYILIKVVGPGKGIWLTGLLGGLASSTALTLNMAQRSRENESYALDFTMSIVLSWSMMYARLYLICIFLIPSLSSILIIPLLVPIFPCLVYFIYLKLKTRYDHTVKSSTFSNPFRLLPAIKFGLIFTGVLFIVNAARVYFGKGALIGCSFLGGATEMDAVIFSLMDMSIKATLSNRDLVISILFASLANTITKGFLVYFLGAKSLRRPIIPAIILTCVVTIVLILLYCNKLF